MHLMPIVWVTDMAASRAFYRKLGGEPIPGSASENWIELAMGTARLALHRAGELPAPAQPRVSLAFYVVEPLEQVAERLRGRGLDLGAGIVDEDFGRYVACTDPDGNWIQINEHPRDVAG